METTTAIRIVAGALAVLVLLVIIWRRKRKALE
jgi:LPXTG-motif cell wall-anchored protein